MGLFFSHFLENNAFKYLNECEIESFSLKKDSLI